MTPPQSCIALIPARSGSERVKDKNIRPFCGHPLIAYTIAAALESGVFGDSVFVSSDSENYLCIARCYGANIVLRPAEIAKAWSPDLEWVSHALHTLSIGFVSDEAISPEEEIAQGACINWDAFAILRPTSPFRSAATIRRAWEAFVKINRESAVGRIDSLRAVRLARERPEKMWRLTHPPYLMTAYLPSLKEAHSQQYRTLEEKYGRLYVQTSSLEIAWCDVVQKGSIAGQHVHPFMQEGYEGLSIDTPEEWDFAQWLAETGRVSLPCLPPRCPQCGNAQLTAAGGETTYEWVVSGETFHALKPAGEESACSECSEEAAWREAADKWATGRKQADSEGLDV